MRAVRGAEKPVVQWVFLALAIVLTVLVAALSVAVLRLNGMVRELRTAHLEERTTRDQLEARLAREQSTREALSLEFGRLRGGQSSAAAQGPPTLTLQPLRGREATPPPPTMSAPAPAQMIELRLVLPAGANPKLTTYELTVRDWVTGQVRLTRGAARTVAVERGHAVSAYVPGDVFAAGSHEVILKSPQSEIAVYEITIK